MRYYSYHHVPNHQWHFYVEVVEKKNTICNVEYIFIYIYKKSQEKNHTNCGKN